jgi:hypothetical protein
MGLIRSCRTSLGGEGLKRNGDQGVVGRVGPSFVGFGLAPPCWVSGTGLIGYAACAGRAVDVTAS